MIRPIVLLWLFASTVAHAQDLVTYVRAAIARNDFAAGDSFVAQYKAKLGVTPEMIEAVSWLGRGALAAGQLDRAGAYAAEAHKLALAQLTRRKLDAEPLLPQALGASIEVEARVMDARGQRGEAVNFLRREIKTYWATSIRARIQKNIHELSLEGKPAPPLDVSKWLGPKPATLEQLRGKPLVLFFWAHWCADCKQEIPLLSRLSAEYAAKGLLVVGPTQHYGYVAGGVEASPQSETAYIDAVRRAYYSTLSGMSAPLSEENFQNYGVSSTPTLVMVDRKGIVRVYHPGAMSYPELIAGVMRIL
jgi:thiol-disulfide isomerase/thioredoxin